MFNRIKQVGWVVALAPALALSHVSLAADPAATQEVASSAEAAAAAAKAEQTGANALAERFCEIGQNSLRTKGITPAGVRRSAALIKAAMKLNPKEPRYPRLLSDAMLQLKDVQGAIDALNAYRDLLKEAGQQEDRPAQIQLIELYLTKMETADEKIGYLQQVLDKPQIPSEVRSHAAIRCALLLIERGQKDKAILRIEEALRLNPLNLDALGARYELVVRERPAVERASALMAMLRSNPAQLQVIAGMAEVLAEVGLVDESLRWYGVASTLTKKTGEAVTPQFMVGQASELFMGDQTTSANGAISRLLEFDPGNVDALFIKLVIDKASHDDQAFQDTGKRFQQAIANRMAMIRNAAGDTAATTQPVDSAASPNFGDPAADQTRIHEKRPDLELPYRQCLIDLAWYEIYFRKQPDAARTYLDFLKATSPDDSVSVARLEGWSYLVEGKKDEAKVKLSAVADRDPLAAMGLLRLTAVDDHSQEQADSTARKLVSDNPSGIVGVILWENLRDRALKVIPGTPAEAIRGNLSQFPMDWLNIIERPHEFYALRAEPLSVLHEFGQPLLARVTLQNVSNFDLTIGPKGIIKPGILFDASLRGVAQQQFQGIAFETLSQQTILKPRQSISQIVRIDQGALGQFLRGAPNISLQVFATVMTNPTRTQTGIESGAAGYRVQFLKLMERQGVSLAQDEGKQKIYQAVALGTPEEQIRGLDLLATYCALIRTNEANEKLRPLAIEFSERVSRMTGSPSPTVSAWSSYLNAMLTPAEDQPKVVKSMVKSGSAWQRQMLGLVIAEGLSPDLLKETAQQVAAYENADPLVKEQASAIMEMLTEPTTQKSDGPASNELLPIPTTMPLDTPESNKP